MLRRFILVAAALALSAGCAPQATAPTSSSASASCAVKELRLVHAGQLTVGTDKPAYEPWFSGGDPSNGKGYESAVAYAVAEQLGFTRSQVHWTTVPFNNSYAPGTKTFDFDINQISITPARKKAVDFSDGYYTVDQAVIALKGSSIAKAKSVTDLAHAKLGAQVGTTSLTAIQSVIKPSVEAMVYNDTNDGKNALQNHQVDGIVADLPTAFYLSSAVIHNAVIVGQFHYAAKPEQFGMLLQKGSSLTGCVNQALGRLKSTGELAKIQDEWLAQSAGAPRLAQ